MNKVSHDSETPAHGQQVITVCAFLHHEFDGEEKVFLPKRAASKKFLPNKYELPGGHVDFGEDLVTDLSAKSAKNSTKTVRLATPSLPSPMRMR